MSSKILPGTCAAQVVSTAALPPEIHPLPGLPTPATPPMPVPLATILGQGVGASTGIVIFDGINAFYIPDISGDLKTTLEQVVAALTQVKTALDQIGSAFTTIDGQPTGGTGSAVVPTVTANVTAISTAGTAVETAKTALNTLKGALK
jgi:hypothetical protein